MLRSRRRYPERRIDRLLLWTAFLVASCLPLSRTQGQELLPLDAPPGPGLFPEPITAPPQSDPAGQFSMNTGGALPYGNGAPYGNAAPFDDPAYGSPVFGGPASLGEFNPDGTQEAGAMNQLSYSQAVGGGATLDLFGSLGGPGPTAVGANLRLAGSNVWSDLRDFQIGASVSEDQTLYHGGGTLGLTVDDRIGLGGRILLGGALNDVADDEFQFSGDLLTAYRVTAGEHWFKAGMLYDRQGDFSKIGPELGALFFGDSGHPLTVDFAYGFGNEEQFSNTGAGTITQVADEDIQLRVGTYLNRYVQVGATTNWAKWDNAAFEDYEGIGGFLGVNYSFWQLLVDVTTDDDDVRGFVNLAMTTGAWSTSQTHHANGTRTPPVHPRDWLTRPVFRNVAVQLQEADAASVTAGVSPGTPIGGPGTGGPGTGLSALASLLEVKCITTIGTSVNNFAQFPNFANIEVQITNISTQTISNVQFARNTVAVGPATVVFATGNATPIQLPPATTAITGPQEDITLSFAVGAIPGTPVFIEFDVIGNGQVQRYQCGPIIIGQVLQQDQQGILGPQTGAVEFARPIP